MFNLRNSLLLLTFFCASCGGGGSSSSTNTPLQVRFGVTAGDQPIDCFSSVSVDGPEGRSTVGLSDLRFFVSDVVVYDQAGQPIESEMDFNEFQYKDSGGSVGLIDLTGNVGGTCENTVLTAAEGTSRTNDRLALLVEDGKQVGGISFAVGVPQPLMKQVISTYSTEAAPSPLGELYWSWAAGYRHFVLNFQVERSGTIGEGYIHIGSRDCGGNGVQALLDREQCGLVNTPRVMLDRFDPATQTIAVDILPLLNGLVFVADVYDTEPPYSVIGRSVGASCHSAPVERQPDCGPVFDAVGLNLATGEATAGANSVFKVR